MVDRDDCENSLVDPGGSFKCEADEGSDHKEGEDLRLEIGEEPELKAEAEGLSSDGLVE
jgi:hypothetical protein